MTTFVDMKTIPPIALLGRLAKKGLHYAKTDFAEKNAQSCRTAGIKPPAQIQTDAAAKNVLAKKQAVITI
jgi:hypothetical protein